MKKIYLSVIGFSILCRLNVYSQTRVDTAAGDRPAFSLYSPTAYDTTDYRLRRLKIDEIDLVSSYYSQNGDHSPITGGIGTERVTDFSNGLNLNLVWLNQAMNKNTLAVGLGYDHHTSASAAFVALHGGSNPNGTRIYPSLDWTVENAKTGGTFGIGAYYSGEYNYKSKGLDMHWSKKTNNKSGEFDVKLQGYFDQVRLIFPSEFVPPPPPVTAGTTVITTASGNTVVLSSNGQRTNTKNSLPSSPRTTLTAAFSYSQQINSRLQVMFLGDVVTQSGYLGLPFHRVYFNTGKDTIEKLPSSRFKLPVGFMLNYFLGDNIILRSYYRYYVDSWGMRSNTASLEIPYKVTPFFSISPFYRYYDQTAARYFLPYEAHNPTDAYYTSNYAFSKFQAGFYGIGFRIAPPKGVFGWQNLHELEIRYGHYTQTTDMVSDVLSVSMGFK
ncbi:MAG TPA: DUF3570 domain-containing protein [Mucilaginibacter sp.]